MTVRRGPPDPPAWDDARRRLGPRDPMRRADVLEATATGTPWTVVVDRAGCPVAAAAVAVERRRGLRVARHLGDWAYWFDPTPAAADIPAARSLARGLACVPADVLHLRGLAPGAPATLALATLPGAAAEPDTDTYRVRPDGPDLSSRRTQAARTLRRLGRRGHRVDVERHAPGPGDPALAAALAAHHAEWERRGGGLHTAPAARDRLAGVVRGLARDGLVRASLVRVDGRLTAFAVGVVDGPDAVVLLAGLERDAPGASGLGLVAVLDGIDALRGAGATLVDLGSGRDGFKRTLAYPEPQMALRVALTTRGRIAVRARGLRGRVARPGA
ncbi:MAG: GNAT family N-acetyltransferase [Thermoleophilia bacterium]|nr:GNAT family N-acetyltransferase [Thermoleophilia bacterium]